MQVVLIILSMGLLGLIIYFAVSPKSSKLLRISAFAALGLIGISIGVCVVLLIKGPGQDPAAIALPVFQDTPTMPASKTNVPAIIVFIVVLLAILGLIIFGVRKDQRRPIEQESAEPPPPAFPDSSDLELGDEPMMTDDNVDDDSFDIDI